MSKSVLVMDTPESCADCKIGRDMSGYMEVCIICPITNKVALNEEAEAVPDWCPLKLLPEKMKVTGLYNGEYFKTGGKPPSYKIGWNACVDEITGGGVDD